MKRFDQINVIPFIDIMLVMLAIVLTTATFIAQGTIPVALPETEHADSVAKPAQFEIVVDQQGRIFLADEQVSLESLDEKLAQLNKQTRILLRVDSESRFEVFVSIVDRLKGYGLTDVSILSQKAL